MNEYSKYRAINKAIRLPLKGKIDLTYRCQFNCLHCWLRQPPDDLRKKNEVAADVIKRLVDEARDMGCREWFISGGEPLLRPDFPEIYSYIARSAKAMTINTNGGLITPKTAALLKSKGAILVSLYGADENIQDKITRCPGSFASAMRGVAYLREAGVPFTMQIVPMRANHFQLSKMIELAESLSENWRYGVSWLYLSADRDPEKNENILNQRLEPGIVAELNPVGFADRDDATESDSDCWENESDGLFFKCISHRQEFHMDPYGRLSFCEFIQDPALRYDFTSGRLEQYWNEFMPAIKASPKAGPRYQENCGSCEFHRDCLWCPAYGFLEHGDYSAEVSYLCAIARENRKTRTAYLRDHRRIYGIAGMTLEVISDHPIKADTFHPKFGLFEVQEPGKDNITISHHFSLPDVGSEDLGREIYRKPPWAIYQKGNHWIYAGIYPNPQESRFFRLVVFNREHTRGVFYSRSDDLYLKGGVVSLTLFPSDQILLARLLADRQGFCLHSSGVVLDGCGLLFAGQSGAGKSTVIKMLADHGQILCDDRMIIRKWPRGFKIHGTWSHGEVPVVSPDEADIKAIFFLEQATENRLEVIRDSRDKVALILARIIKPFLTADWWDKTLGIVQDLVEEVPCYRLFFDKSGRVVDILRRFCADDIRPDREL